jgi:hypothetical protein
VCVHERRDCRRERRCALEAFAALRRRSLQRQRTARATDAVAHDIGGAGFAQIALRRAAVSAQQVSESAIAFKFGKHLKQKSSLDLARSIPTEIEAMSCTLCGICSDLLQVMQNAEHLTTLAEYTPPPVG